MQKGWDEKNAPAKLIHEQGRVNVTGNIHATLLLRVHRFEGV
jgi:hypothetical protein